MVFFVLEGGNSEMKCTLKSWGSSFGNSDRLVSLCRGPCMEENVDGTLEGGSKGLLTYRFWVVIRGWKSLYCNYILFFNIKQPGQLRKALSSGACGC